MKRRYVRTLIVGLIFVGLVIWIMLNERGRVVEKGEVFALQLTDLSRVSMKATEHQYTLERRGEDWWFTEPFEGLADSDKIKPILDAVASLKPLAREDQNLSDPEFGLQAPVVTLDVTYGRNRTATIRLGAESPLGQKYFASISGKSALFLIDQLFKSQVDQDPEELRDKRVLKLATDETERLTLWRPERTLVVGLVPLAGEPTWQITSPRKLPADKSSVEGYFRALSEGEAVDFLAYTRENLVATGLDKPALTLSCEVKGQKAVTVWLGKQEEREIKQPGAPGETASTSPQQVVYVMRAGRAEILALPASYFASLDKTLLDLRDKHLMLLTREKIKGLAVAREKGVSFRAIRSDTEWQIQAPKTGRGASFKLDGLVSNLIDLQAIRYEVEGDPKVALGKYGLQAPQVAITIAVEGGQQIVLYVGSEVPEETGRLYARTSTAHDVYVIDDTVLQALPETADELLATTPDYSAGNGMFDMSDMPPGAMPYSPGAP